MLFILAKIKMQLTHIQKNKMVFPFYGKNPLNFCMSQKWLAKFCVGEFSLNNVPESRRPVAIDDDQIKKLYKNNNEHGQ